MMRSGSGPADGVPPETSVLSFAVVPVPIPLLARTAAISSVMIFTGDHQGFSHRIVVTAVIVVASAVLYVILRTSPS